MSEGPVSALDDMLAGMAPELHRSPYRFDRISRLTPFFLGWLWVAGSSFCIVREKEGITQITETTTADKGPLFARITLQVHSDLEGVGLTAAVSSALAQAGIACNVIAAFHHDHLFVSWERRKEAMVILQALSAHSR